MENIIEKLGLYDIFARGLTGTIIILVADLFGILDQFGTSENSIETPFWAILAGGYFCGLVLEELSYICEKLLHSREKIEEKVGNDPKYRDYLYEECKDTLFVNGKNDICDEPLVHIVMSSSFKIAFLLFAVLILIDIFSKCDIISSSFICPAADFAILIVLAFIFHYRASHYSQRRAEQIFDYCIRQHYPGIKKTEHKDTDNET